MVSFVVFFSVENNKGCDKSNDAPVRAVDRMKCLLVADI
jgi:hypothetical protein